MKKFNPLANRLALLLGPIALFNDKEGTKLTYKGVFDINTNIMIYALDELCDTCLLDLIDMVEQMKEDNRKKAMM